MKPTENSASSSCCSNRDCEKYAFRISLKKSISSVSTAPRRAMGPAFPQAPPCDEGNQQLFADGLSLSD
jgi:hypothetical protein